MVTVWQVPLRRASSELPHRFGLLSADERVRALRQSHGAAAASFVMVRSVLRGLLGELLGQPAAAVRILRTDTGKPRLDGDSRYRFSVAHTHDLACIAITDDGNDVGVDVESWADISTSEMHTVLTPRERTRVASAPDPRKAFYDCWARKEAMLKVNGAGLSGLTPELAAPAEVPERVGKLYIADVPIQDGYSAAFAVECRDGALPLLRLRNQAL